MYKTLTTLLFFFLFFLLTVEDLQFIESPWATPCLVLYGFMFNCHSRKNNKEYWRCHNYSKKIHSERCRIRCVIENGKLKSISGGGHNHAPHTEKIEKMLERSRMVSNNAAVSLLSRIKIGRQTSYTNQRTTTNQLTERQQLIHNSAMLIHE